ncbi:hypothetical protein BH09ACT4_BH09ACT4_12540 [soil metagenome]
MTSPPRIGLALSGGGFRATAFGLGALRALHDRDLLRHVTVVSGISGGSLLAAMWAYGPQEFAAFDESVVKLLRDGLQAELVKRAASPKLLVATAMRNLRSAPTRTASRTEALVDAIKDREFGSKFVDEVTHSGLSTVISATDLATSNAVRFGSDLSSCSPFGQIQQRVSVAEAVAASAAFPALLPALSRTYSFVDSTGAVASHDLVMTDGGVFDNLGVSPILPGRSRRFTSHVYDVTHVIAVDAGRGKSIRVPARFMLRRLAQSFDIAHTKSQDGARTQLNMAGESGRLESFVHTYIGMNDSRIPIPLGDLVPRSAVSNYPTNFARMRGADLAAVTIRGEQLTRVLVQRYFSGA